MGLLSFFSSRKQRQTRASAFSWQPSSSRSPTSVIGGRRHLADVPYLLPKDAAETSRLNFQHHLLYTLRKKHYEAPIDGANIRRILDVGTGTGIWAYEMARLFPQARVIGFDLDPTPASTLQPPPNYAFVQGNILDGLPFASGHFDYVHQRLLVAAIPAQQWPGVVRELVRVTCVGGYVELLEASDLYLHPGPTMHQFLQWSRKLSAMKGLDPSLMPRLGAWLRDAGLSLVKEETLCVPLGSQGGRVGELLAKDTISAFENLKGVYCTSLSLSPALFDRVLATLPQEWNQHQTSAQLFLAYGCRR